MTLNENVVIKCLADLLQVFLISAIVTRPVYLGFVARARKGLLQQQVVEENVFNIIGVLMFSILRVFNLVLRRLSQPGPGPA